MRWLQQCGLPATKIQEIESPPNPANTICRYRHAVPAFIPCWQAFVLVFFVEIEFYITKPMPIPGYEVEKTSIQGKNKSNTF
jgi:hypothetical protein